MRGSTTSLQPSLTEASHTAADNALVSLQGRDLRSIDRTFLP